MNKKAQMFVVTMVFLAGLIFVVQQLLLQYAATDSSRIFQENDQSLIQGIDQSFDRSIKGSPTCLQAEKNVQNTGTHIENLQSKDLIRLRYNSLDYPNLRCENQNSTKPVLVLDVNVISTGLESNSRFEYFYP